MSTRSQAEAVNEELLRSFPLVRCARMAASIDVDPEMKAEILGASNLSADDWEALDDHWQEAILADVQSGKLDGRAAYDDSYVARIEEERGPLNADDYGALVVAEERGSMDATLSQLALPEESVMPIERVWLRRAANDAVLARALRGAIVKARAGDAAPPAGADAKS